ncbi:unnamed protein product [Leptidea sinapis]|uniref:BTB domain-containing protein n=1 Tax=Leptidea sinapis TaxID=189913 RepID=A0A5E4QL83_9NEOP|nr:unnamed protein product [Leptidea sinapis]
MTSTDTYQLKWHSHSSHLNGSVAALLRSERFTDVVLCTMDGSQIPAHKFILSSCSVYFSALFEGQRSVIRMGGMLYVVLPSEISTKALKILVEYMYKGETTVSNEVLDTVLKAGEVLKIRGLWRQTDEAGGDSIPAEKTSTSATTTTVTNKTAEKPKEVTKIALKNDDKIIKTFSPQTLQGQGSRPMFIGPPKLVFIKRADGTTKAAIQQGGVSKGQTILVSPAPSTEAQSSVTPVPPTTVAVTTEDPDEPPPTRVLRRHATERKYGKRQKTDSSLEEPKVDDSSSSASKTPVQALIPEVQVKEEPEWDASSIEEEERSIAEMFQAEMKLAISNNSAPPKRHNRFTEGAQNKTCMQCKKIFPSHASMLIHMRTHTGERPFLCGMCNKGFNVKSNLLRHLRTLHDHVVSPAQIEDEEPGPSHVKKETDQFLLGASNLLQRAFSNSNKEDKFYLILLMYTYFVCCIVGDIILMSLDVEIKTNKIS